MIKFNIIFLILRQGFFIPVWSDLIWDVFIISRICENVNVKYSLLRDLLLFNNFGGDNLLNLSNLLALLSPRGESIKLSQATGISTGNISDWKKGKSRPTAEALVLIANYFNCSVDYLLGRTNIKSTPSNTDSVPGDNIVFFNSRSPEPVTIKKAGRDGKYSEQQFTIEQAEFINTILSQSEDSVDPRI